MLGIFNPFQKRSELIGFLVLAAAIALLPSLNAFTAEDSALHFSSFKLGVWGKYLCYAVLAMSLNMLWGYTGLLCLGQCLFFALGGYAFGMYLMLMIGVDSVYNTALPDFMDFEGYAELPFYWEPFHSPLFAILAVILVPGFVAFLFGLLAFRSRIKGVYFAILTQALTYAAFNLFNTSDIAFGATNGFTNFKYILGADLRDASTGRWLFIASGVLLLMVYLFISWLLTTKFGKVQEAIRDSENRVRFSGYSTTQFKLFVFVVSAMIAGLAGALYVPQAGIINPTEMLPAKGLDIVVWVAVGGRGTKLGPVIGAVLVSLLKSYTTQHYPNSWLLILGGLFVLVVLFMPDGIVGLINRLKKKYGSKGDANDAPSPEPVEAS